MKNVTGGCLYIDQLRCTLKQQVGEKMIFASLALLQVLLIE